ncbi:uncharacterized protein LOC114328384 [Diabrotica virgifera virgifera]|uniref:Uncharacterized protein LOC114328384 n=1 Tax=Diabrotica virgifera virgifera TaxID=50390 RepID=A0A6P7FAW8_DIAVI|nr:uncharacterized protein LOC114328384 [Diabrotica virgifera virgifera]
MDESAFKPAVFSTVSKKKIPRKLMESNTFEEGNSIFSVNNTQLSEKSHSEINHQLEEQRSLAKQSLQRANKVAGIPSKYFRANFSKSETTTNVFNESTVSESDLLQTPRNASTPRNSIADNFEQLSLKVTDANFSIDNVVDDIMKMVKNSDEQKSSMFRPGEEAASMLLADELSWRRKNEVPFQDEFSERGSVGEFFRKKSETLSNFLPGASPDTTREPVPLIEPEDSIVEHDPCDEHKKSLSISLIQKMLSDSNLTPKTACDNIFKFGEKVSFVPIENKSYSLPGSRNLSYTSDHSENDAIKHIHNKENIDSLNVKTPSTQLLISPTRSSSRTSGTFSRASSSLSSLQNGKLPIETTKCELVWGCVKVGKSVTQEFGIRNRSSKRLGIQLSLSSQEFKIRKDNRSDSEPCSVLKLLLHPHETRSIIISFIPTKKGAAIDELLFTSLDPNLTQSRKQCMRLFGYGGSFKIDFSNVTRDTTGKFWLSLGKLDDRVSISSTFKVKNKGDTPIFVYISIQSLDSCKLSVAPNFFVVMPQTHKEIVVRYRPSTEDYNFLHKSVLNQLVLDLGVLNVVVGTEVDRGRIRKVYEKCVETGFQIDQLTNIIKEKVDNEAMPTDLIKFGESPIYLKELLKLLNRYQIVLTLERDPEQTIFQHFSDDSGLYQSLYQDKTVVCNKTGGLSCCHVAPAIILLTLPYKYKDSIFIKSDSDHKLNFKVSAQDELEVKPKDGSIEPHSTTILSVKYQTSSPVDKKTLLILIDIENEVFEVVVNVDCLGQVKQKNKSFLKCV